MTLTRNTEGLSPTPIETPLWTSFPERKPRPVVWWAAIGAAFLALQTYVIAAWIISGDATPTDAGPTDVPGWMEVSNAIWQIGGVAGVLAFFYFFVYRPWRRNGRLSTDGLFVLTFATIWWWDPMQNWLQIGVIYNADMLNAGSWLGQIPGYTYPNVSKTAEAPLFDWSLYIYGVFGMVLVANLLMRKLMQHRPQTTKLQLIGFTFAFFAVFDIPFEILGMATGAWAYPGAIEELTLFSGHYYQFPIYEAFLWGGIWTFWACLRFFKNDKGQTWAEAGVDRVAVGDKRKTGIRFLAIVGISNVAFLVYTVALQPFVTHPSAWPEDITSRSYLVNELCGYDTGYACFTKSIPLPVTEDAAHVDPEGNLIVPEGRSVPGNYR